MKKIIYLTLILTFNLNSSCFFKKINKKFDYIAKKDMFFNSIFFLNIINNIYCLSKTVYKICEGKEPENENLFFLKSCINISFLFAYFYNLKYVINKKYLLNDSADVWKNQFNLHKNLLKIDDLKKIARSLNIKIHINSKTVYETKNIDEYKDIYSLRKDYIDVFIINFFLLNFEKFNKKNLKYIITTVNSLIKKCFLNIKKKFNNFKNNKKKANLKKINENEIINQNENNDYAMCLNKYIKCFFCNEIKEDFYLYLDKNILFNNLKNLFSNSEILNSDYHKDNDFKIEIKFLNKSNDITFNKKIKISKESIINENIKNNFFKNSITIYKEKQINNNLIYIQNYKDTTIKVPYLEIDYEE